ncbi:MAG: hypothetical protein MJ219_00325 [Mycoplasmoidaceae bacterium]|nr:hypothetical protein [Mycoplasmoidaceae bacterium]
MGGIKALVDEFSPDDNVEFVTVDQILQLITDNVKHVHAEPQAHAPVPVP